MTLGFVMLAHDALHRVEKVARHLAAQGCPVTIHIDARADRFPSDRLTHALSDVPLVDFAPRLACDWGTWSLVRASRSSALSLLRRCPDVDHVYLISGACLPIRPVEELKAFLAARKGTDFIESVTIGEVPWTQGGLSEERFNLSFPFAWKRRRRLFDLWVDIQRRTGFRRRIPADLDPHMGSQWWCLSRATLLRIAGDPDGARIDRFFSRVWIPDESYYQTMVRRHASEIESRSLTLSKFDFQGKPHLFYDDHLDLLRGSGAFFARKIWRGADRLYSTFLGPASAPAVLKSPVPDVDRVFSAAVVRRTQGRPGLLMAGRFPAEGYENGLTAAPYSVFHGFGDIFAGFPGWVSSVAGTAAHGHLFAPERAEFAGGATEAAGGVPDSAALRDYNSEGFLVNVVRGEARRVSLLFSPRDRQDIAPFLARDANASIFAVSGAWALPLLRSGLPAVEVRSEAARLQRAEAAFIAMAAERRSLCQLRLWTLTEFMADPTAPLKSILEAIGSGDATAPAEMPVMHSTAGLGRFLQALRNMGMNPHTVGAPHVADVAEGSEHALMAGRRG